MADNYFKKFTGSLCKEFNFEGIPVRVIIRDRRGKEEKEKKVIKEVKDEELVTNVKEEAFKMQVEKMLKKGPQEKYG